MKNKRNLKIVLIIVAALIAVVAVIYSQNISCSGNPVEGTYQGDALTITLKGDKTFNFYNSIAGTSAKGNYSYTLSDDGKKANITLNVVSGLCSYGGAVVYFYNNQTVLSPTINGREVVARMMYKI